MQKKLISFLALGAGLIVAGAVLLVVTIRNHAVNIVSAPSQHSPVAMVPAPAPAVQASAPAPQGYITGTPTGISIPSLGLNLPVIPGYFDASTQEWTLTTTKVQFATPSTPPNNRSGNTFMYGHARRNIFGSLPKLQSGDVAIVTTDNGHKFYYTLASTQVVDPTDAAAALHDSDKPTLTLQTCVGLLYQSRELLTFNLQRVV